MRETGLIERKDSIFSKVKRFFRKLFYRNKNKHISIEGIINESNYNRGKSVQEVTVTEEPKVPKVKSTKNNITEDPETLRLLKLQNRFAKGKITEESLTDEDVKKLHKLYDKQIEEINNETKTYKEKMLKLREKLDKNALNH